MGIRQEEPKWRFNETSNKENKVITLLTGDVTSHYIKYIFSFLYNMNEDCPGNICIFYISEIQTLKVH